MAYQRLPDPTQIEDQPLKMYLAQLIKILRVNIESIFNGAVFTQFIAGFSKVFNNQTPWIAGSGVPEGVVTAPVGSIYTRTDGLNSQTLYIKENGTGNTGWQSKADVGTLFAQTSSTTVGNTGSELPLTGTGVGTLTLTPNQFIVGKSLRIRGRGVHSSTGNPTLTINIKYGTTLMCTTGAINTKTATNDIMDFDVSMTCRTIGVSGTVFVQGMYAESGGNSGIFPMVNTSATVLDTTISQAFSITAQFGTPNVANTLTLTNLTIEILN